MLNVSKFNPTTRIRSNLVSFLQTNRTLTEFKVFLFVELLFMIWQSNLIFQVQIYEKPIFQT